MKLIRIATKAFYLFLYGTHGYNYRKRLGLLPEYMYAALEAEKGS
jgi:hypothetical protein